MFEQANNDTLSVEQNKPKGFNARFEALLTPKNTALVFWLEFACFLLYTSYAPADGIESKWVIYSLRAFFLATIGMWIVADGKPRGIERGWLNQYLVGTIFLVIVAVPIYLVHSRGWAGAARSTLRFIGYLLLSFVIWFGVVGILAVFGIHEAGPGIFP